MKARFPQKLARKVQAAARQRLPQKSARKIRPVCKVSRSVGTETELPAGEPVARTFTVSVISAETIAAGFPFGIRINVDATTAALAAGEASDQVRRLCNATREELVAAASRALRAG